MPVRVANVGSKYRVVDVATGRPTMRAGKPVDGGGHSDHTSAVKQVEAINMNMERKKGNKRIPPRPKGK